MFVFRSLALGLLGASCWLLATRPQPQVVASPPQVVVVPAASASEILGAHARALERGRIQAEWSRAESTRAETGSPVTVIDVAPGVTGELLAKLIVVAANEHIVAIDDAPVRDARAALASLELRARRYVDVAIASDRGDTRRVLVLPR